MPAVIVGEKGRYAIGASLGSGGMATVHRGVEIATRRPVAIKRLHPHLLTNSWIASRFREEATLARRLDHPNVAKVLDLVETAEGPALVLELYDGGSLLALSYASWNRGDPLPVEVASAIVLDVLAALGAAHGLTKDGAPAPVVHRDVSPHNVLFGRDGVARLADFGVARATDKTDSTDTGSLRGKLSYMAPELFSGKRADPRSDLYGAGVILWELLASERLFEGEVAEVLGKMLAPDRSGLALAARGVPAELEAVVLRALAADPTQRFKDAEVMAEALRAAAPPAPHAEVAAWVLKNALALPGENEIAVDEPPPSSLLETTRHPRRRSSRPRRWLVPGIAVLLLVAGLGAAAWRTSSARLENSDEPTRTTSSTALAPTSSAAPSPVPSSTDTPAPSAAPIDGSAAPVPAPSAGPRARSSPTSIASPQPTTTSASAFEPPPPAPSPPSPGAAASAPARRALASEQGKAHLTYMQARAACPDSQPLFMRVTLYPDGAVGAVAGGLDKDLCVTNEFHMRFSSTEPFTGDAVTFTVGSN